MREAMVMLLLWGITAIGILYLLSGLSASAWRIAVALESLVKGLLEDDADVDSDEKVASFDTVATANLISVARELVEHYESAGCESIRFVDKMNALRLATEKFDAGAAEEKA